MSETGLTRFPVVNNDEERTLAGMVALSDLLQARSLRPFSVIRRGFFW
jgi:CBS domain-containing protein